MASSSSHSLQNYHYQVFLSFRGSDTRQTFVSHLYKALRNRGILTFKDDRELEKGDSITDEIRRAIRSSRFAVVVISENYASSRWCLDELQLIMELQLGGELIVFPIFYRVEPSDVRHQKGCFAESFQKHETRENAENVSIWTEALNRLLGKHESPNQPKRVSGWREACIRLAELSGVESTKCVDEATMIDEIIEDISCQLPSTQPLDFSNIVGMTDQMSRINPLLEMDSVNVRMIGIWGMGGIGKTTLANYLYEEHKRNFAPHHCFMLNISKLTEQNGLLYLQKHLLSNIFRQKNMKLESVEQGRQQLELRLRHLKVLIVLDDVDDVSQVDALAKSTSWFGQGSRIIITTRDRGLLKSCRVDSVHEVKCLNDVDSLQMFNQITFEGGRHPSDSHKQLAVRASQLVQGLPFAIEVFGEYMRGKTTIEEWVASLRRLERQPPNKIMQILELSYKGLEESDKNVFLHIVFLFNGSTFPRVTALLGDDESETKLGLTNLLDKSLISVSSDGCICMHVLVEQMGRQVVHLAERKPHRRRFLRDPQDIYDVSRETKYYGTEQIQCIILHMCELPMNRRGMDFLQCMRNLKFLKLYKHLDNSESNLRESDGYGLTNGLRLLHWDAYPSSFLGFRDYIIDSQMQNMRFLVEINMRCSHLEHINIFNFQKLRRLDLTGSRYLRKIAYLSTATKLEELFINDCTMLKIPESICHLPCLRKLSLGYLYGITKITSGSLSSCRQVRLTTFPGATALLKYLTDLSIEGELNIDFSGLKGSARVFSFSSDPQIHDQLMTTMGQKKAMPHFISEVHGFKSLKVKDCMDDVSFRCSSFSKFLCLIELSLVNLKISKIPDDIGELQSLERLDLSGNDFVSLPTSMGQQAKLKYLSLCDCSKLESLPQLAQVERLTLLDCVNLHSLLEGVADVEKDPFSYNLLELCLDNCKNIDQLSYGLSRFIKLTYLDLSRNDIHSLPSSIKDLSSLVTLCLTDCKKLTSIEELPLSLKYLSAHGCSVLMDVSLSSDHSINHLDFSHCFKLVQIEEIMTRFLYNQHSEEVPRFACLPATEVPSFCNEISSGTSLPLIGLSPTFMGFYVCIMIASKIHLQFPTLSYTWNWEVFNRLSLNIRPDIYHPYQEYEFPTHQLLIIHFPSSLENEVVQDLQFEAKLEFAEEIHVPKVEITSCGIRVMNEDT